MEKSTRLRELIIDEISANDQPIHQSIIDICHSDDNQIQLIFMLDSDPSIFFIHINIVYLMLHIIPRNENEYFL